MSKKSAFRNQRPAFRNPSPPYAEKTLEHPRWLFPSRKNGRQVVCWTPGEYHAVVALETAPPDLVQSYEERPELVQLRDGPDWYRYTPSFLVVLHSGPVMVELSAQGAPRTPRQALVARLAKAEFARRGIRFAEIAHGALRVQPRARDAALLVRYISTVPTAAEVMQARDVLSMGPASIARVEQAVGVRRERLIAMVRRGELQLVGSPPITLESKLAVPLAGGAL